MNSFRRDLLYTWNKHNSGVQRIIIINVAIFILLNIGYVVSVVMKSNFFTELVGYFATPFAPSELAWKPWTLFTGFFTHIHVMHILGNMLGLFFMGVLMTEFMGNNRFIAIYIFGGLVASGLTLLTVNLVPFYSERGTFMIMLGASGAVNAVITAIATHMPEFRVHLLFFGPVKLKYIALITFFLSVVGSVGHYNVGGELAHLYGVLAGFIFTKLLHARIDLSVPIMKAVNFVPSLIYKKKKKSFKVAYKGGGYTGGKQKAKAQNNNSNYSQMPDQEVVDAILDKISEQGYEKLTTEEKQILFKASQKK